MQQGINGRIRRKLCSVTLASVLGFTGIFAGNTDWTGQYRVAAAQEEAVQVTREAEQMDAGSYGLCDKIQDGTILHCFSWKYNDIKDMLPDIADAGFTSVQTSPAQPGGGGNTWYMLYQPLGFYIGDNELGTKSDLEALCSEADKYGIKVVVDVVANHLAGDHSNIDNNLKDSQYWHNDLGHDINYLNRGEVHQGRIGMPDINSEHGTVQQAVRKYVDELKSAGVDGIRWDAAKHIGLPSENCNFWPTVTEGSGLWHYGEILDEPVASNDSTNNKAQAESLMKEYSKYMSITDSIYGVDVRKAFRNGGVPGSIGNWSERGVAKNNIVYWAESHDTYSNNNRDGQDDSSQFIDQNKIDRAYAIVASQNKASALYFSRPSSTDKESIKSSVKGSTHFTSKEVAAVNHFHNAMVGQKEYYVNGEGTAAVCREKGAVIVKGSGSGQVTVKNGGGTTAPGTYKDEITGNTWEVTATEIKGTIGDSGIAVVYNGGTVGGTVSKNPTVSASKASGSFSEPFELTLTPSNATKATYSVNGGDTKEFTSKTTIKIGEGCSVGDKVTVKVTAEGEGDSFSETFTYTMAEAGEVGEAKFLVRVKKSDFTEAPYIYAFSGGTTPATEYAGKWPGTKMEADGDYFVFQNDSTEKATVILHDGKEGGFRNTQEGETEVEVTGMMEYDKSSNSFKTVTGGNSSNPTATPRPTDKSEATATPRPTDKSEATATPRPTDKSKATATPRPTDKSEATATPGSTGKSEATATPRPTDKPRVTATPRPTEKPNNNKVLAASLSVSKKSPQTLGTSVKISLKASGGVAPYKYTICIENSTGVIKKLVSDSAKKTFAVWKTAKKGTYKIHGWVQDAKGNTITAKPILYKVKSNILSKMTLKSFKVNKTKAKVKTKIKMSATVNGGKGVVKYKYTIICKKAKYKKTRKYSKVKKHSFIPKKAGKYIITLFVKNGNRIIIKQKTVTIHK